MRKYSLDQEQLEAIKNGEIPLPDAQKIKMGDSVKEIEMSVIEEEGISRRAMQNAMDDSAVKPMVNDAVALPEINEDKGLFDDRP